MPIAVERLLPHLVLLAAERVGARSVTDHQRLAVGERAVAVATLLVAELVEQRIGRGRIVFDAGFVVRVVADHAGRNRELRFDRLIVANHPDFLLHGIGHRHRAPQRDLVLGEAAHDRVHQVPVVVRNLGIDKTRQADPLLLHVGRQRAAVQDLRRQRALHVHEIELAVLEGEEPRLVLLHDADLDAADLRHLLALHLGDDARVVGIGARLEIPREAAEVRIRLEVDLRRADPFGELVRAGADRDST